MAKSSDQLKRNDNSIKNPGAAVVIFNYKYRLGESNVTEEQAHEVDQIVLNTVSLMSVSTSKSKSQPAGRFEFRLAPTKNWVNTITPGSWCAILMSQELILDRDTKYFSPKADFKKVKMLGRIESVRSSVNVNQQTGAIQTEYVVQGEDWGGIFNTNIYVDPLIRSTGDENVPIGAASRYIYNSEVVSWGGGALVPSSSQNIESLLAFWGKTSEARSKLIDSLKSVGRIVESENQFRFPKEVKDFFEFKDAQDLKNPNVADIIEVISGKTDGEDNGATDVGNNYSKVEDGAAPIFLDSVLGNNTFWQLIVNNSNHWINETYPEMRWERVPGTLETIRPKLVLYNRIKPFSLKSDSELQDLAEQESAASKGKKQGVDAKFISDFNSKFKNIRRHEVPIGEIISVDVGTNWRDRYNFAEVNVSSKMLGGVSGNDTYDAETKLRNQTFDRVAIGRDGFKPMFINAKYIPRNPNTKKIDIFRLLEYKVMTKEWFFNIHRTFNGSITLVGQSDYIAVGDNIIVDADAIFPGRNANIDHINSREAFFLAHIESVGHSCTVNESGSRNFITQIQFVRGIIVDSNGNKISETELLDQDVSDVTPSQELNSNRSFGTSAGLDPDIQKLEGN